MIRINKGETNSVFVTVTELTTIDIPYYLVKLQSNDTDEIKILRLGTNSSTSKWRFDSFLIEETDNEDLDAGKITLIDGGSYDYTIYQTPSFSGNSPSLLTNNNIVEVGSLQVGLKTPLPAKAIYTNTNTIRTYGE